MALLPSDVAKAVYVVDKNHAGEKLHDGLNLDPRGRKSGLNARLFLIGVLLCIQTRRNAVLADIYRVLTQDMDHDWQVRLGVRTTAGGALTFSMQALDRLSVRIEKMLEYGDGSAPELTDAERERRRAIVMSVAQAMLDATLPTKRPFGAHALDTSAFWAWGRAKYNAPKGMLKRDAKIRELGIDELDLAEEEPDPADKPEAAPDTAAATTEAETVVADPAATDAGRPYDQDAGWAVKTTKDGGRESVYGYDLHALVYAPDLDKDRDLEATLVGRFDITTAGRDVVAPSLRLIDASIAAGVEVKELLADRHYSYKRPERWAVQLTERGIKQVVDLHKNDQGFRDYNGAKLAAGWLHCPRTPDALGTIPALGPSPSKDQIDAYNKLINERRAHALGRVSVEGRYRFTCPALAGTVGCDRRPGSIHGAIENALPVIANPPKDPTAPKCCTQVTVELGDDGQRKLWQQDYWGSKNWVLSKNRRTFVEGAFGNVKNPSTENLCRGFFRITGLGRVTLLVGIALVAHNMRQLRNWHERTGNGDPTHPLLQPNSTTYVLHLTPDRARRLHRVGQQSATTADRRGSRVISPYLIPGGRCRKAAPAHPFRWKDRHLFENTPWSG